MKAIVLFYSRTAVTKKAGMKIAKALGADVEEITDKLRRKGAIGYIRCGREAMAKTLPKINKIKKDLSKYDIVIIGTPIWGWKMSSPIRTFITDNKDKMKDVAFFCTQGRDGHEKTFKEMEEIIGKKPMATIEVLTKEVAKGEYSDKIKSFVSKLK